MKLAVYLPDLAPGGAERLHVNLAPFFLQAGCDVTFVLQRNKGALLPLLPKQVHIVSLESSRTLTSVLPLMCYLRREQPDILLSNLGHNNIAALWARALAHVPTRLIASYHGVFSLETAAPASWQYRSLPFLSRHYLKQADAVVAVSGGAADDLAALTQVARERICVIHNALPADCDARMRALTAHPWLEPGSPPLLLAVGRLVPSKDFATLLNAFAQVVRGKDMRLMILGDGPLRAELTTLARTLRIANRVRLTGYVENPLPFMRKAAALVMSSRHEGFGNVLAEALACGTNVVSTDCPFGPSEIVAAGRFGRLAPVGDAGALARAICATLENPLPAALLQERAQAFTPHRIAGQYLALMEQVLGEQAYTEGAIAA